MGTVMLVPTGMSSPIPIKLKLLNFIDTVNVIRCERGQERTMARLLFYHSYFIIHYHSYRSKFNYY